jgi:hypothetical protein
MPIYHSLALHQNFLAGERWKKGSRHSRTHEAWLQLANAIEVLRCRLTYCGRISEAGRHGHIAVSERVVSSLTSWCSRVYQRLVVAETRPIPDSAGSFEPIKEHPADFLECETASTECIWNHFSYRFRCLHLEELRKSAKCSAPLSEQPVQALL